MRKRITMSDVAVEAGVSKSTVSFVLNRTRPISKEVTRKVNEAVKKLRYTPNEAAQQLSRTNNRTIGILVESCSASFAGVIIDAINQNIVNNNYRMQICIAGYGKENAERAMASLVTGGSVQGIINMHPDLSISEAIKLSDSIPVITYLRSHVSSPVYLDFISGMREAMDYLYGMGHRKIGFIGLTGNTADRDEEERLTGYKQYMVLKGLGIDDDMILLRNGIFESGIEAGERLYNNGATAIVCGNDQIAAGVLFWSHEKDIKVPGQLSVIGFDDSPIAYKVYPPLTTVQIPAEELAEITVKGIIAKIENHQPGQHRVLTPRLIVRKSVGPVPQTTGNNT